MRHLKGARNSGALRHAVNMGQTYQATGYQPYINLTKGGFNDWGPGGVGLAFDANGDVSGFNVGATIVSSVWGPCNPAFTFAAIKTGTYIIKWTGTDLPLAIACTGSSGLTKLSANRWSVSIPQIDSTNAQTCQLQFTNNTASTNVTITSLVVVHSSHETAQLAGSVFNPDWITALNHPAAIRPMKALLIENSTASIAATDFRLESWRAWCDVNPDGPATSGMPYTALAKLAVEANCDVWAICPARVSSQAEMNALAALIWSVPAFQASNHKLIAELGNENWNSGYTAFNWLNGTFGPSQTSATYPSGLTAPQAEAKLAIKWWKALENAGIPRNRIIRSVGVQGGGSFGVSSYTDQLMHYIDEGNILGSSGTTQLWQLADQVHTATYVHVDVGTHTDQSDALYNARFMNIDWQAKTDADIDGYFNNGITITQSWLSSFHGYFDALVPSIRRTSYEFNQDVVVQPFGFVGGAYEFTINAANNTLQWVVYWSYPEPVNFTDGDQWQFKPGDRGGFFTGSISGTVLTVSAMTKGTLLVGQRILDVGGPTGYGVINSLGTGTGGVGTYNLSSSSTVGAGHSFVSADGQGLATMPYSGYTDGTLVYIKAKNANEAWIFASDAARLADVGNVGAGAINLNDTTATTTSYWAFNFTRATNGIARFHTYMDSSAGSAFYQRVIAAQVGVGKLQEATQLYDFCGYSLPPLYAATWGLKYSIYAPDTPRSLYFTSI